MLGACDSKGRGLYWRRSQSMCLITMDSGGRPGIQILLQLFKEEGGS